ncbi:MAG TPA: hypothetical protein VJQ52_15225 [Steroidobacteraceae bacterium]|nr:hypothetical protein [Steroidobacteraceae bacterium]
MKTFTSTAIVAVALACSACGGGAPADEQPQAQPSSAAPAAATTATSDLPIQFKEKWVVEGECTNLVGGGTGLQAKDMIEIEERAGFKITLSDSTARDPDPTLLQGPSLGIAPAVSTATPNVLSEPEAKALCAASTAEFVKAFTAILAKHGSGLTHLIGVADLHDKSPGDPTLLIFLPYTLDTDPQPKFFLAAVPMGHEHTEIRTHNGIVHGHP